MNERPEGIIITISQGMLREKGYRNWLRNFTTAMQDQDMSYWMRLGSPPKHDVLYVYLCIGGKIRYRANFVMSKGPGEMTFSDDKKLFARAWVILAGPVERPRRLLAFPYPKIRVAEKQTKTFNRYKQTFR